MEKSDGVSTNDPPFIISHHLMTVLLKQPFAGWLKSPLEVRVGPAQEDEKHFLPEMRA